MGFNSAFKGLKYFVIELFGLVAAYYLVLLVCVSCTVQSESLILRYARYTHQQGWIICGHETEQFNNEVF